MRNCSLSIIMILFLLTGQPCPAQNLVSNPSFESFSNCPLSLVSMPFSSNFSQFPTVNGWSTPVKATTPDYLNDCAPASSGLQVPLSTFGYQPARTGAAYTGIIPFQGQFVNGNLTYDYREYLQTLLNQQMAAGKQYCVSFYVSPTISPNFTFNYVALDELGINFSVDRPVDTINRTISLPYHIKNQTGNFLSDTSSWYRISGVYQAGGGEKWLTLGCFNSGGAPAINPLYPTVPAANLLYWTYLFVDDVEVYEITGSDTISS